MELADAHGRQLCRERLTRPADLALLLGEMEYVCSQGFSLDAELYGNVASIVEGYLRQSHDGEKTANQSFDLFERKGLKRMCSLLWQERRQQMAEDLRGVWQPEPALSSVASSEPLASLDRA